MSKPSNSGRPPKRALIVVGDEESTENQPAEKSVRGEAESVSLCDEILSIHQKVAKLEKERQGAIRTAGEAQARAEFAENLINNKRVIFRDEGNRRDEEVEELQKKLSALEEQQEEERAMTIHNRMRDRARIVELERIQAANQKKVNSLKDQLDAEKSRANEEQLKASESIIELSRMLAEAADSEKRVKERYQKKVSSLTKQLEEERSQANEDRKRDQARITELEDEAGGNARGAGNYQKRFEPLRVRALAARLAEKRSRANEDRMRVRARIDELEEAEDAGRAVDNFRQKEEEKYRFGKLASPCWSDSYDTFADRDRSLGASRFVDVYAPHHSIFDRPEPLPEKQRNHCVQQ